MSQARFVIKLEQEDDLKDDIVSDPSLNNYARNELLGKLDSPGARDEVEMTYDELQQMGGSLMSRRKKRFMGF